MSGYDRIHVHDRVKLSDLDDDPQLDEWGVRIKPQQESSLKRLCSSIRKRPLALLLGIVCAVLMVLIIIIIATVEHSRRYQDYPEMKYPDRDIGLFFEPKPQDGSNKIHYSPLNFDTYKPYVNQLNFILHDYNPVYQQDLQEGNDDCKNNTRPANKICRYTLEKFGQHECSYISFYGFKEGMPCIFLNLKLPDGAKPRPVQEGDPDFEAAKAALGANYSPDFIGVTCNGTTKEDQSHIGHQRAPMQFFPPEGFPVYLFPNGKITPQVAVKFGAVADLNDVSITCRAWLGALGGKAVEAPHHLFTATFVISKYGQ